MNCKQIWQLLKGWKVHSGPPDAVASNEPAAVQDTTSPEEQNEKRASEELSNSETELARLKAEYMALAQEIRMAERRFQHALRALHSLRCR